MKKPSIATCATLLVMAMACPPLLAQPQAAKPAQDPASKPAAEPAKREVFAKVNGRPVSQARADMVAAQMMQQQQQRPGGQPMSPTQIEAVARDQVVLREMFVQEAVRRGLSTTPKYIEQIQISRENILMRELLAQLKTEITDAEVRAEFEKIKGPAGAPEVRVRHILVKELPLAKSLLAQIKGGAKFEDLAKKHSIDQGSATAGGDLDWAPASTYVPEFSKAVSSLKKGELAPEPVKTSFGYHIIRVEDTREAAPLDISRVEPQIRDHLLQAKLEKFTEDIKARSKTDHTFQPKQP